ncbi:MAG: type 4a pilus biogenesis protein PilO [Candidatus Eisenbacteria bacterium]
MNLREPYIHKGLVGFIVVIALVWLIFFTSYLPFSQKRSAKEVHELRQELQVVTGELRVLESAVRTLPKIKEELKMLEHKWEVLRGLLPLASEMSMLLSDVTTAGMKAGVEFVLFEPEAPELYDLYTRYPISVSVTGGYHEVGRFFDNMCNMERLVGLSEISIIQIAAGEEPETVEASATVSAYTYNVNQAGTAAGTEAPTTEGTR